MNHIQNLLHWYSMATHAEKAAAAWYQQAHAECVAAAEEVGVDLTSFCLAVAALSPMLRWEVNILAVKQLVKYGDTRYGFIINRDKARRILAGDHTVLRGPKVTRFAASLLFPDQETKEEVVIDTWAIRAWEGRFDGPVYGIGLKQYTVIRDGYIQAARIVGEKPGEFQAIVWTVVRNLGNSKGQLSLDIML